MKQQRTYKQFCKDMVKAGYYALRVFDESGAKHIGWAWEHNSQPYKPLYVEMFDGAKPMKGTVALNWHEWPEGQTPPPF